MDSLSSSFVVCWDYSQTHRAGSLGVGGQEGSLLDGSSSVKGGKKKRESSH